MSSFALDHLLQTTSQLSFQADFAIMTSQQQSDNIAHAISGAGGGILSMALTFVALR